MLWRSLGMINSNAFVIQVAVQVQYGPVPVPNSHGARNLIELLGNHVGEIVEGPKNKK